MNTEAKRAISERFKVACVREGLNYSEAARLLGLKNPNYGSMICNEKQWDKCPVEAWDITKKWTNSGLTLRQYNAKLHNDKVFNKALNNENPEKEKVPERPDQKPDDLINRVTTTYLDIALRMCGISLEIAVIDKIIDLVELIEQKGGEVSIEDICKLQIDWN